MGASDRRSVPEPTGGLGQARQDGEHRRCRQRHRGSDGEQPAGEPAKERTTAPTPSRIGQCPNEEPRRDEREGQAEDGQTRDREGDVLARPVKDETVEGDEAGPDQDDDDSEASERHGYEYRFERAR